MIRSILVPLDGSAFGEAALPAAQAIAEQLGAPLHLAHVHVPQFSGYVDGVAILDEELDAADRAQEHAYLHAIEQRLTADGTPAPSRTILDGPVTATLTAYAAAINADLVVMTTHGRSGITRFWLGSVADSFVRHSHVPVLLIHPSGPSAASAPLPPHPLRKICIALDGSPLAEQILPPALALGAGADVEYTCIQVIDALVLASTSFTPDLLQHQARLITGLQAEAHRYLETLAVPLRAEGYRITTRVLTDPQPAHAILRAAREDNSDVVALATHGRSGMRRLLLGSVADKVLRGADRPILLYRPQEEPQPEPETDLQHTQSQESFLSGEDRTTVQGAGRFMLDGA